MPTPAKPKQKKPLDVIQSKGIRIPIYTAGGDKTILAYYAEGRRKLVKCQSLEAARRRARDIVEELTSGSAHVRSLSLRELTAVDDALTMLRPIGVNLSEAVRLYTRAHSILQGADLVEAADFYRRHLVKRQTVPKKLPEVVEEFLEMIKARGRSFRYHQDCQGRLNRLVKSFRGHIAEITVTDLERWLSGIKVTGRNRNNYRATIRTLFTFAQKRGYLPREQRAEAELIEKDTERTNAIGIYTPSEIEKLIKAAPLRFRAFVVLGAFAGLRTAEIRRLDWSDIKMTEGHISLARGKAKTAQRRLIPIQDNLRLWLIPVLETTGPLVPAYGSDSSFLRAFRESLPSGTTLVHNGLRHSYATYRLAVVKSADAVALELGNSPKKLFSNYRELASEAEGLAYFAVQPLELVKAA